MVKVLLKIRTGLLPKIIPNQIINFFNLVLKFAGFQ